MEAIKPARKRGQRMHAKALEENTTCIACHYILVHKEVEPSKAFLDAIDGE
jgi:nitrate/TMAO reductase-like tetraheme cytochrome c subunit